LRQQNDQNCHIQNLTIPAERADLTGHNREIDICLAEAWGWLESQGLLIAEPGINGRNGFRILSRRAQQFEDDRDFSGFINANMLPKELLDDRIKQTVWSAFVRAEYDVAVFQAMKAVEVRVREVAGYDSNQHGVAMIRNAFNVSNGPLTDMSLEPSEREAVGHLFAGAYGYYRNPNAHRDVEINSPAEAIEIVLLANQLLRIIDEAEIRRTDGENSANS